jgi:CheY-like chemotaxis protein
MSKTRTILIVEDDASFADFVRAAVESLGHRAVIVTTGGAALDAFREHEPDLVFLDLLLPQRDGFKICEDIRRESTGAGVPVVMMTGIYKKASYEKEALDRLKAADYLVKPFGVREVWGSIERCLGPSVLKGGSRIQSPAASGWSLQDSPLACQIAEHLRLRSDGVLFVRGAEATFVIYLREGAPVFVRSSDPTDRLDRVIARTTRVGESVIAQCVKEAQESRGRKRFGDVLVEKKHLSRDEIEIALQLQLRLILNRAFQLEKGCCLFVAGEHPTEEDVLLQAHPRALLVRGARSTPPALARAHLPASSSTLVRVQGWEALIADLSLKEDELRLLQLCDGATTVERFLATASVGGYDGARILLALQCAGLVADLPDERRAAPRRGDASDLDVACWRSRPMGALVSDLFRRGATGRLEATLSEGEAPRVLHVRDGQVVAVESESREDRLCAMLRRMEVVEIAVLDEVEATLGKGATDSVLVRTLVDRELLSPTEAYWAAVYQAHGSVHALLSEIPVRLAWTPGPLADDLVALPDIPTIELALNGVRALDARTVRDMLPDAGSRIVASRDRGPAGTPLSGGELAILGRLGAGQELSAFCSLADDPTARARVVLALLQLGLAEATAAPAREVARPALVTTLPPEVPLAPEPARTVAGADADADADADAEISMITLEDISARLAELRPTLVALRSGMIGDEKRISVDRARMAELFDELVTLTGALARLSREEAGPEIVAAV